MLKVFFGVIIPDKPADLVEAEKRDEVRIEALQEEEDEQDTETVYDDDTHLNTGRD